MKKTHPMIQPLLSAFLSVRPNGQALCRTLVGMSFGTVTLLSVGSAGLSPALASGSTPSLLQSGWQRIIAFFAEENEDQRDSNNNGSRPGNGVCLVSPQHQQVLWHREPLLIWQSSQTKVGVRPQGAADTVLWSATATTSESGMYQATYQGAPLEPGETYEWLF